MFDKLIESDSSRADFKPRSRYFFFSSLLVSLLFISAVVFSIYAADIGLGNDNLELTAILRPVDTPPTQPDSPRPRQQNPTIQQTNDRQERMFNIQRTDEPQVIFPPISSLPNPYLSRPPEDFRIGQEERVAPPDEAPQSDKNGTGSSETSVPNRNVEAVTKIEPQTEPPEPVTPQRPKNIGVVNGIAIYLPKPQYPSSALQLNIQGKVDVQITIDESGNVISAKAASGHP